MARNRSNAQQLLIEDDAAHGKDEEFISYTAVLLTQGKHRFFTLAMPSEILAVTCRVDLRVDDPEEGFQRRLDKSRAEDIASYIDNGFGTIPSSIILSAQQDADLRYNNKTRTLRFRKSPRSFLIIDGQHRVFGFKIAHQTLRVPVVIYNNLSRSEEARLFMDINTKQRPVPSELILDIKRLADAETNDESLMRDVFDALNRETESPLFGLLSPSERQKGKLSRTTFNSALENVQGVFINSDVQTVYKTLSAYMHACMAGLRLNKAESKITNPTLFRALMLLFPDVAARVMDRYDGYSVENFDEVLSPVFEYVKRSEFQKPGPSYLKLYNVLRSAMSAGFTLGRASN